MTTEPTGITIHLTTQLTISPFGPSATACGQTITPNGVTFMHEDEGDWVDDERMCRRCLHAVGAPGTGRWGTPA